MSARWRRFPVRWGMTLGTAGALLALGLAGCASSHAVKQRHEAAVYNTELGIAYMRRGQLAVAKSKLDRAERENPDDPDVHSARALLFAQLHDPQKADREFRKALSLAPNDPDYQNNYAVYLCSVGRAEEGVKRFLEAARNPLYLTPALAYVNAGVCLRSAHRYDEAGKMFHAALALQPNLAQAAWQLADLEFARGKLAAARAEIHAFLSSYSETADLLLLAVKVMRAQGDELDAALYARRLQLDYPGSPQARALADIGRHPG